MNAQTGWISKNSPSIEATSVPIYWYLQRIRWRWLTLTSKARRSGWWSAMGARIDPELVRTASGSESVRFQPHPKLQSTMMPWDCGRYLMKCIRKPASNDAGRTRVPACSTRRRNQRTHKRGRVCSRSEWWPTRNQMQYEFDRFIRTYGDKYPKAVRCLVRDREKLLVFYDLQAAHWQSLRITNPIHSTLAIIRYRTKRSNRCLNRNAMLCMMFK